MTIYNVTTRTHGGSPTVHAIDANHVEAGASRGGDLNGGYDTVLRLYNKDGELIAAFYDWDWFTKGIPLPVEPILAQAQTKK